MASKHIEVAREQGAKAGFEFYLGHRTPLSAPIIDEIVGAGNRKKQFAAYCARFSEQLNGAQRSKEQRKNVAQDVSETLFSELQGDPQSVMDKLARLLGRNTDEAEVVGVEAFVEDESNGHPVVDSLAEHTVERTIPAAERISWKMCMALKKRATAWGEGFTITDKDGGEGTDEPADYHVTYEFEDGTVVEDIDPASASELIAEYKAA